MNDELGPGVRIALHELLIRAIVLQGEGKVDAAEELFQACLAQEPNDPSALYSLGVIYINRSDFGRASSFVERGVAAHPDHAPLWFLRGTVAQFAGDRQKALAHYDRALELNPGYTEVLINSGALLRELGSHHESLSRFQRILAIDPDNQNALCNCGILLTEFKRSDEAIAMFERLLAINPGYHYALGLLCYERMHGCDWTDFTATARSIVDGIRQGRRTCKTLALMSISDSVSDHFLGARIFAHHWLPKGLQPLWRGERYAHQRIRIAYVSADLREHPVGHLMAGVLERHDKARFETIAISLGVNDNSRLRSRMMNAFDQFIDVKGQGSRQIAELMRRLEADIAVDLGGYTSDSRTDIFCHRPAPAQVNFLGYPGTLGTEYMDYIIADRHVIPEEHTQFYDEKVVRLPHTYLPVDSSIRIAERTPSRAECGLPPEGFIFCSFSHDYKISPEMFGVWMRLMRKLPDSTLWLMSRGETAQRNLRREAETRGVAAERLVFASRVPLVEDHMARYRVADIFLDTFPYNAHTTAADALMAGLPVVTYMGGAFPARVAGSLLFACELPELATQSIDQYESMALKLATDAALLADIKSRLAANRTAVPLFDTEGFCRNLEAAYVSIWRETQDACDLV